MLPSCAIAGITNKASSRANAKFFILPPGARQYTYFDHTRVPAIET
jgi:hypothetical protein